LEISELQGAEGNEGNFSNLIFLLSFFLSLVKEKERMHQGPLAPLSRPVVRFVKENEGIRQGVF
jgi:hypothetical protein